MRRNGQKIKPTEIFIVKHRQACFIAACSDVAKLVEA